MSGPATTMPCRWMLGQLEHEGSDLHSSLANPALRRWGCFTLPGLASSGLQRIPL